MKDGKHPNPNTIHPIAGYDKEIYVKPTITNPNIIVGDFTYIADSDFESHVSHLYEWNDDKLIIEILRHRQGDRVCDERRKPSDERCLYISVLYLGGVGNVTACKGGYAIKRRYCYRK